MLVEGCDQALGAGRMLLLKTMTEGESESESVQAGYLEHSQDLYFPVIRLAWN